MNMSRRALAELKSGEAVNLGVGIPTLVELSRSSGKGGDSRLD